MLTFLGYGFAIAYDILTWRMHFMPPDTGYPFSDLLKIFIPLLQRYPEFAAPIVVMLLCFGILLSAIILGGSTTTTCFRIRGYQIDVRREAAESSESDPAPAATVFFLHFAGQAWPPAIAGDEIKVLCVAYGTSDKKFDSFSYNGLRTTVPYVLPYIVCRIWTYAMAVSPHPNAQGELPEIYSGRKQPTKGSYDEQKASSWC